jgi:hypothetical protein
VLRLQIYDVALSALNFGNRFFKSLLFHSSSFVEPVLRTACVNRRVANR